MLISTRNLCSVEIITLGESFIPSFCRIGNRESRLVEQRGEDVTDITRHDFSPSLLEAGIQTRVHRVGRIRDFP